MTAPDVRPAGVTASNFKNRYLVSGKLHRPEYVALMTYCKENGLSINSAIRRIINTYFNLDNV